MKRRRRSTFEMRIKAVGSHAIGSLAHGRFLETVKIDKGDLGIRLADVDDGDGFHGITSCERQ